MIQVIVYSRPIFHALFGEIRAGAYSFSGDALGRDSRYLSHGLGGPTCEKHC